MRTKQCSQKNIVTGDWVNPVDNHFLPVISYTILCSILLAMSEISYKNFSILLCTAVLGIVVSQPVYAIDGDYVIPYTDNYGYVYDPKTGSYIQQPQPTDTTQADPAQPQTQAANHPAAAAPAAAAAATPAPVIQAEQSTTITAPQQTSSISLPVIVAGTIVVLGVLLGAFKFFSKKS